MRMGDTCKFSFDTIPSTFYLVPKCFYTLWVLLIIILIWNNIPKNINHVITGIKISILQKSMYSMSKYWYLALSGCTKCIFTIFITVSSPQHRSIVFIHIIMTFPFILYCLPFIFLPSTFIFLSSSFISPLLLYLPFIF